MDGEGDLRWIWIWMAVDESRIFIAIGSKWMWIWMAMDESIRTERVDVMWCRLGIAFGLSLEFWNSGIQIACAKYSYSDFYVVSVFFTSYQSAT